jgi:hypothetical protein
MVDRVTLYRAPSTVADADAIADWLDERVDADVDVRGRFLERYADENLPEAFARARVLDPYDRETGNAMTGIVRYEERALEHPERAGGVIYDGLALQRALNARLPDDERDLDHLHVDGGGLVDDGVSAGGAVVDVRVPPGSVTPDVPSGSVAVGAPSTVRRASRFHHRGGPHPAVTRTAATATATSGRRMCGR